MRFGRENSRQVDWGRKVMDEKVSVLIVDDNGSTRKSLSLIFRKRGYETETAGTGREAMEKARDRFFNVALLDLKLPDMEGTELLASLKGIYPDMVVIMVTGYASLKTSVRALSRGALAYLIKPLNVDEVLATVKEGVDKQHLTMENRRLYQEAQRELAERKQAEEALRESEASLAEAQRIAHLGNWDWDIVNNTLHWSEENYRIFGLEPQQFGATYEAFMNSVHPDDREFVQKSVNEALYENKPCNIEHRIVLPNGSVCVVHEQAEVTFDERGKPSRMVGTVQDITERKQLWKKMVEYEELDKLKTSLLSTVSHELRTPLAIIKGYSTMLLDYDRRLSPEEKDEHLHSIDKATDRLTDLVDRLLDMSRLDAGLLKLEKVPTSISKMIKDAVVEAKLRAPGHKIVSKIRGKLPEVSIDARRIREVLDNLIDNAVKYSKERSRVVIEAKRVGAELHISVVDRGVGIPAEELERIFDRMYRAEQRLAPKGEGLGLGLGLGLAISKGLVEAHGGRIWMESNDGKGSKCVFTLPL